MHSRSSESAGNRSARSPAAWLHSIAEDDALKVNFYATLRPIVGGKTVEFSLALPATVRDLLDAAAGRFPPLKPLIWNEQGELGEYIKVFVNGREIRHLALLETPLQSDSEVDVFPPVAGG